MLLVHCPDYVHVNKAKITKPLEVSGALSLEGNTILFIVGEVRKLFSKEQTTMP